MNFIADLLIFAIVFYALFLIPWYRLSSMIGLNCESLCFSNQVKHTYFAPFVLPEIFEYSDFLPTRNIISVWDLDELLLKEDF